MKKALLTAGLALFGLSASAQWNEGSIMATGNLGFSTGGTTDEAGNNSTEVFSNSGFNIGITGGYFIQDNLAVGVGLGFINNSMTIEQTETDITSNTLTYGVFGRYYVPYNDKFSMYGQLSIGLASGTETEKDNINDITTEANVSAFNAGLGIGLTYFVNDMFFLDASYGFLGYNSSSTTQDPGGNNETTRTVSNFGLDLDLSSIAFGVGVLF
ncbi:MAG: porin family protein [Bacteroidetes bacterium]|nr:MAG: porin family protein [Bacteroidota bacterium]